MDGVRKLPLVHQTMFAELTARCLDAAFDRDFPENGRFLRVEVKGRGYWYYSGYDANATEPETKRIRRYVGPESDEDVTRRVHDFRRAKADYTDRRDMVRSLVAARLPRPPRIVGDVVEGLWKAGLFRLRGVLVGTTAFQTYAGRLGTGIPDASTMTGDVDFEQFQSIATRVDDELVPPMAEVLREVDPSFVAVPHMADPNASTKFANATGFQVEFLTPNRGSDDLGWRPMAMPALGGVSAQPLRYLDFLISSPATSVLLHRGGIPVAVPAPERYALHKLIVAHERRDDGNGRQKARKDIAQSGILMAALALERRTEELAEAWVEAWERGPQWRVALGSGRRRLDPEAAEILDHAVRARCRQTGRDPDAIGIPAAAS